MAVAILNSWTLVSTATASPGSKTISAGSNRVLFYQPLLSSGQPQNVTSVTYGGQAMTMVETDVSNGDGNDVHGSFWILNEAGIQAATDSNFAITRENTNSVRYRAFSAVYQNVDQADPIVDSFSSTSINGADPATEAVDTVNNGVIIAGMFGATSDPSGQANTWNNLTELLQNADNVHYLDVAAATTDGSSITPNFTLTNNSNNVLAAFSLRASTQTVAVNFASETDYALGLGVNAYPLDLGFETDAALSIRPAKGRTTALLVETDVALSIAHARGATIGTAEETETAFAIGHSIQRPVGLTAEADTAFAFAHVKTGRLGIASEQSTAASVEPVVSTGARLLGPWSLLSTFIDEPGSFTMLAGLNRFLFYKAAIRDGVPDQLTSVTYGGQPMTRLVSGETHGTGPDIHSSVWGLDEAGIVAATSSNFAVTRGGVEGISYRAHAALYQGVDQETPVVDSFTAVSPANGTPPTTEALATLDRGIAVAFLSGADAPSGAQDAVWSNLIERIETVSSSVYVSVSAIGTDGVDLTPVVALSNQSNTILQGIVLSPVNVEIFEPVGVAQETDRALAIGANEPVIDLLASGGTLTDGATFELAGLDPADGVRALVVAFTIILDQSAPVTSEDLDAATVTYGGVALRRLDSFTSVVDKDRAFLAAFALDRPLLVPGSGSVVISLDIGGLNYETIAAAAAFIRGPEQLLVSVLDQSETALPALSVTDSGTAAASGLLLGFTAAAGLATMAGDVLFGERAHVRQLEAANTSVSLFVEERRGGAGGAFSRTTTIDALTHLRSITLQITKVADVDVAVGLAEETSEPQAFAHSKLQDILPADETDEALSVRPLRTRAIGIADETDAALSVFPTEITTIGFASETDAALSIVPLRTRAIGLASEADVAFNVQTVIASKIVRAQNWTLVTSSAAAAVGGVAFTTNPGSNRILLVAIGEESTSHEPSAVTYGGVAMTLLTNPIQASPGGFPLTYSIWGALESQLAGALDNVIDVTTDGTHDGSFRLYAAVYHNVRQSSQPIDYDSSTGNDVLAAPRTIDVRARGMAIAMWGDGDAAAGVNVVWTNVSEQTETNTPGGSYFSIAEASTNHGTLTITPTSPNVGDNVLIALSLAAAARVVQVNQVEDVQAALPVVPVKTKTPGLASETDTALSVTPIFRGRVTIGQTVEADVALPIEVILERTVKPALETDQALNINPVVLLTSTPAVVFRVEGDVARYDLKGSVSRIYTAEGEVAAAYRLKGHIS